MTIAATGKTSAIPARPRAAIRALLILALGTAEAIAADHPDFESMPCPQRREQVIAYWGGLPPSPNACEAARRKLAVARDLVATKQACGETRDWTTRESAATLSTHEQDVRLLCTSGVTAAGKGLRKTGAGDAGVRAGCPGSIRIGGQSVSVLEPIQANGGAETALSQARSQLRHITDQGSCDGFANAQECESTLRSWRDMVSALECHARAERDTAAQAARPAPSVPPPSAAAGTPSAEKSPPGKSKGKAEDFLGFADPSGTPSAAGGGSGGSGAASPAPSRPGAGAFLPFAGKEDEGSGQFPTPHCQFLSDKAERHDQGRMVCHDQFVYECESRASPDPKKAWRRLGLTRDGCGGVRTIEAVERDRKQLKRATKGMFIHD